MHLQYDHSVTIISYANAEFQLPGWSHSFFADTIIPHATRAVYDAVICFAEAVPVQCGIKVISTSYKHDGTLYSLTLVPEFLFAMYEREHLAGKKVLHTSSYTTWYDCQD